ncbi:4-galactosyl-N-acetylglucosaminide 3-alpha-L-fucosyltransferase 9-like [Hypomesus transpacificus]|uniref:4-galactosyl-N-acetylglucosaminide 3-alpha-L-fucosyltransferase 9-like n=1 Tax=Hypomesus transpacificus TaxID=137520 RepID=UPI001F0720E3|nr:4-galactosyl-N-acetylglucosaminide 3-alpha-L-fucosyltransferase 9-like [Hypomesus transpacificus]XP_046873693.1 4-galactosyl-N-acetylglucosaminide 3-alpha-L-fucosyltransferase 9-like [Hypomesus transpacificus]XP_046873694.1 4-galactosyl-N-acetylglucosaminide 3-alpha-L-fucosyltransferase 9-like [Hypomesus transpacificus]XP_046873696.1 4-galactosyl-N-acetylglucosaminide 3-alpha-L-fucosyltransferase 9-like [Hypomesus transpacificus]
MTMLFCKETVLRPALVSSLVVVCFLGLFNMYNNPNIFSYFSNKMLEGKAFYVSPGMQNQEGNQTKVPNQTTPHYQKAEKQNIQVISRDDNPETDTILLIWMWPFGSSFDIHSCADFNIQGCHLTDDKSLYNKAHGVLFHHRDIHGDLGNMPREPRPWFQKWVWFNAESPANSNKWPKCDNIFNLTTNYRHDSSVPVPYGSLVEVTGVEKHFELPTKDKLVCWIVSNWHPSFRRVQVYTELSKHVKVEAFGQHFGKYVNNEDYTKTISGCKFYLSFENSIFNDYITEKLYNAMSLGAVPVVLGPSRQIYENFIPADSFLHVDDFPNQKELADRLLFLDTKEEEYMKYHSWRKRFKVKIGQFGLEHACRSCDYIRRNKRYNAINNLNQWYWG